MDLIKVKSSQGSLGKNIGCREAPDKIVDALEELNEEGKIVRFDVDEIEVVKNNLEETNENIFNKVKEKDGVLLGGDHSISYMAIKAFCEKYDNAGVIIFDAHPDCENNIKPPSHEDFLRVLIEDKVVKKENVILVGLRRNDKKGFYFLKDNKIRFFSMKDIFNNLNDVCDSLMEMANEFSALYLSIDIDVVDPAFAPGTGYIEAGGMSSRELIYFIQRLKLLKNLRMVDIMEVNPDKDVNEQTIKLAAKIIEELIK